MSILGYVQDTKIFTIKHQLILILLAFWYSLVSILLGLWSIGIMKFKVIGYTASAIGTNLMGGIDHENHLSERKFDPETNYIWNNLTRESKEHLNKATLEIILEIQDEYEYTCTELYTIENINYINSNLSKIKIKRIRDIYLNNIFTALEYYKNK